MIRIFSDNEDFTQFCKEAVFDIFCFSNAAPISFSNMAGLIHGEINFNLNVLRITGNKIQPIILTKGNSKSAKFNYQLRNTIKQSDVIQNDERNQLQHLVTIFFLEKQTLGIYIKILLFMLKQVLKKQYFFFDDTYQSMPSSLYSL